MTGSGGRPRWARAPLTRRQALAGGGLLATAALAACAQQPKGVATPDPASRAEVDLKDPRLVELGKATQVVATRLLQQLRSRPGNVVVSPYAVVETLGAIAQGATTETLAQLLSVAGTSLSTADTAYAANGLTQALGTLQRTKITDARTLFAASDVSLKAPFRTAMARSFGLAVQPADFGDEDGAADLVNGWVRRATAGEFTRLVGAGQLVDDPRLVGVAATAVRALWRTPFDPAASATAPFTLDKEKGRKTAEQVEVPTMSLRGAVALRRSAGGTDAFLLPYEDGVLRCLVVAPPAGGLDAAVAKAGADTFPRLLTRLEPAEAVVTLPRVRTRLNVDLAPTLAALGAADPFDPLAADFTAMTRSEMSLRVVAHQATFGLGERGTLPDGDATGALTPRDGGAPYLRIDRPFLFWVFDARTRNVVLAGLVRDPSVVV